MGSGTFYPAVSGDDGYFNSSTQFDAAGAIFYLGAPGGVPYNLFIRFPSVTIPAGSTITSAYVKFYAWGTDSSIDCDVNCYFNDVDNATAPTDYAGANGLSLTSAVAWNNVESWTLGTQYNSVSLVSILQDIIDRGGWATGQAVQLVVKDNGSSSNHSRTATTQDASGFGADPELHVEWSDDATITAKPLSGTLSLSAGVSGPALVVAEPLELVGSLSGDVLGPASVTAEPLELVGTLSGAAILIPRTLFNGTLTLINSLKVGGTLTLINSLNVTVTGSITLVNDILGKIEGTLTLRNNIEERPKFNGTLTLINHILDADSGIIVGGDIVTTESYIDPGGYVTPTPIYNPNGSTLVAAGETVPQNLVIPAGATVTNGFYFSRIFGI